MLPIFSASRSRNYTCEAAYLLIQHSYSLFPCLAQQILWNKFAYVHVRPGCNVLVEILVEIACIYSNVLGSNKSKKTITSIAQSTGTLPPVMDNFDEDNRIQDKSSTQKISTIQEAIQVVVNELLKANSLQMKSTKRKHSHFPNQETVLKIKLMLSYSSG